MSAVEDMRKLPQDFLAPKLRATRLDALESRLHERFLLVEQRLTQSVSQRQQDKLDTLRATSTLADCHTLSERLARLESKQAQAHS